MGVVIAIVLDLMSVPKLTGTESTRWPGQEYLYGITLYEVRNQLEDLEKPYTSRNADELLMRAWTSGANDQAI